MKPLCLIMFLLLGMASTLMIFIGWAFKGDKRKDSAFAKGFYLSMTFVVIVLILFFIQLTQMYH